MKVRNIMREYGIFVILLALIVFFSFASPVFLTSKNILTVARQISMVTIAALGMMIVMLTGGIDLSVGSLVSFTNVVCAYLMAKSGWSPIAAISLVVFISLLCGFIEGVMIAKLHMPPLIVTLGFMELLSGLAFLISGALPISGFPDGFKKIGQGMINIVPIPVICMVVVLALGFVILYKTYFGRYFFAIGGNKEAAKFSGINVDLCTIGAYMFSSFFACVAGVIMLSRLNVGLANNGDGFEMDAITAVVLGGVSVSGGEGKLSGVIAGSLIVGFMNNGLILLSVNDYVQTVLMGIVLLVAVAFDCIQKNNLFQIGRKRK